MIFGLTAFVKLARIQQILRWAYAQSKQDLLTTDMHGINYVKCLNATGKCVRSKRARKALIIIKPNPTS
jgi:hypothetical protein